MVSKRTLKIIISAFSAVAITAGLAIVVGLAQPIDYGELSGILSPELLQEYGVTNSSPFVTGDSAISVDDENSVISIKLNEQLYSKRVKGIEEGSPDTIEQYLTDTETPKVTAQMLKDAQIKPVYDTASADYFSDISITDINGEANLVLTAKTPIAAASSYQLIVSLVDSENNTTIEQNLNFDFKYTEVTPVDPNTQAQIPDALVMGLPTSLTGEPMFQQFDGVILPAGSVSVPLSQDAYVWLDSNQATAQPDWTALTPEIYASYIEPLFTVADGYTVAFVPSTQPQVPATLNFSFASANIGDTVNLSYAVKNGQTPANLSVKVQTELPQPESQPDVQVESQPESQPDVQVESQPESQVQALVAPVLGITRAVGDVGAPSKVVPNAVLASDQSDKNYSNVGNQADIVALNSVAFTDTTGGAVTATGFKTANFSTNIVLHYEDVKAGSLELFNTPIIADTASGVAGVKFLSKATVGVAKDFQIKVWVTDGTNTSASFLYTGTVSPLVSTTRAGGTGATFVSALGSTTLPTTLMQGQKFLIRFDASNFAFKLGEDSTYIKNTDAYRKWLKSNSTANFGMEIVENSTDKTGVTVQVTAKSAAKYEKLIFWMDSSTDNTAFTKADVPIFTTLNVTALGSTTLKTYNTASITGFATSTQTIGQSPYGWTARGSTVLNSNTELDYVKTNEALWVGLTSAAFTMDGLPDGDLYGVTKSQLSSAKVTAASTITKGSKLFNKVSLETVNGSSGIKISFVQPYVSTKIEDFDITVSLKIGTVQSAYLQFTGTVGNPTIDVYNDDDSVDLSDGSVALATEAVKSIEIILSDEVSLKAKMSKNRLYYATADTETVEADDTVLDKYSDIEMVYNLRTIGLSSSADKVTFSLDEKYHVYDANLIYLGTSDKPVVYSVKYYMATKKLGVPGDTGPATSSTDGTSTTSGSEVLPSVNTDQTGLPSVDTTGDTTGGTTNNFNPPTGR